MDLLLRCPLFQACPEALVRDVLARSGCSVEEFSSGAEIYRPDRFRRCLGLLLSGRVLVTKGSLTVSTLEPGDLFGAAALYNDAPDYATTLTAQGICRCLLLDQELLDRMKGVTRVKFYVSDDEDGRAKLETYTRGLGWEYTVTPLADNDWAYSWQKYYKPLSIGERLYVVPQWEREEPVPQGRVPFYLNPGLTFGTGSHASTAVPGGVEAHTRQGDRVLDLGCGSGILSIAALVLGAERASAVDIDPRRWMWPMRMPPSTASAGTAIPSGREISSPTGRWPPSWPVSAIIWCWPTSWPT